MGFGVNDCDSTGVAEPKEFEYLDSPGCEGTEFEPGPVMLEPIGEPAAGVDVEELLDKIME